MTSLKLYSDFSDIDSGHDEDFEEEDIYKRQLAYPPFPVYDPPHFPNNLPTPDNSPFNKKVTFDLNSKTAMLLGNSENSDSNFNSDYTDIPKYSYPANNKSPKTSRVANHEKRISNATEKRLGLEMESRNGGVALGGSRIGNGFESRIAKELESRMTKELERRMTSDLDSRLSSDFESRFVQSDFSNFENRMKFSDLQPPTPTTHTPSDFETRMTNMENRLGNGNYETNRIQQHPNKSDVVTETESDSILTQTKSPIDFQKTFPTQLPQQPPSSTSSLQHSPTLNNQHFQFQLSSLSENEQSEKSDDDDEDEEEESDDAEQESDLEDNKNRLSTSKEEEEEEEYEEEEDEKEEDEEEEEEDEDDEKEDEEEEDSKETEEGGKKTLAQEIDEKFNAALSLEKTEESERKENFVLKEKVEKSYSAEHDMEFAVLLDDMINKLHGTKLQANDKTELANKLSEYISKISPSTLSKNLSQLIPLVTSIASENNFSTSLSILNTINILSQRFKEMEGASCDLTWLVRRLCTFASESRSTLRTEGFLVLKNVISGFGIDFVLQPLIYILSDFGVKGGGRIKSIAIDAISYCVILFPRDAFHFNTLAEWACKMLWNSKRRVRQASLELVALIQQSIGTSAALALFRQYIDDRPMNSSTATSSSENIAELNAMNAINARISRHLLPTLSHTALVDYGVVIPFNSVVKKNASGDSDSLNPVRSGSNKSQRSSGADIEWVLRGRGPLNRHSLDHHNATPGVEQENQEPNVAEVEKLHHVYSSSSASSSSSQRNVLPQLYSANEIKNFEPTFQTFQVYRMEGYYNKWEPPSPSRETPQQPETPLFSKNWKSSLDVSEDFGAYPESDFLYRKPVLARQGTQTKVKTYDLQLQDVSSDTDKVSDDFLANLKVSDHYAVAIPPTKRVTQRRPKKPVTKREPIVKKQPKQETNTLQKCLGKLNSTDWLVNIEGFANLTKLIKEKSDEMRQEIGTINKNALKHLSNLRSQVCRAACVFFKEMFLLYGKMMEPDCEKIIEKLMDKTCDVNKFIREDASAAVMEACEALSFHKILQCFEAFGVKHRNPVVRATTARMISHLVTKHGTDKSMDMSDRLLPVLVRFLQEGSLETRTHAKETIAQLMSDITFEEKLKRHVGPELLRAVAKNLNAIRNRL